MAERIDDTSGIESTTIGVFRTAATVKGGRRFSFSSMVVVGDRNGGVGFGYGKANQVPQAIEKAQKEAKRRMRQYPLQGRTLPHVVEGKFGACTVRLLPASPGTGVIAGAAVRAPLEMLGIRDCLTKSFGSTNSKNLVKAVFNGLDQLRSKALVEELRGLELGQSAVEEAIERTRGSFTEPVSTAPRMAAPEARGGGDRKGKQRGPAGGRSRRRGGREDGGSDAGESGGGESES